MGADLAASDPSAPLYERGTSPDDGGGQIQAFSTPRRI